MNAINMTDIKEKNYQEIKEFSLDRGASLFGVADITPFYDKIQLYKEDIKKDFPYAISLGYHLSDAVLDTIIDRPNKLYYRHYKMANSYLDLLAMQVGERIQRRGYRYIPIPSSQVLDWDGLSAHASHRAIGVEAGLGFRGRSGLLINPQYGARVRYVSILTNMPLKSDKPLSINCGDCTFCMDFCPAGAISEEGYNLDQCHEMLKHFGKTLHVSLICGVCQKVCPGKNPKWKKDGMEEL